MTYRGEPYGRPPQPEASLQAIEYSLSNPNTSTKPEPLKLTLQANRALSLILP